MKKTVLQFLGILLIVLVLLAGVEAGSYFLLPEKERSNLFFTITEFGENPYDELNGVGFDEIDPLIGWSMSDSLLRQKGFKVEGKNIVLKTRYNKGKPLVIYLSGGSTTDLAVLPQNWPLDLVEIFDSNQINTHIIIGAVGGYNSGQELLKLQQYDYALMPDIHISYSGANELEPSYVQYMEQRFFHKASSPFMPLMPNTIAYIRKSTNTYNAPDNLRIINYYKEILKVYPTGNKEVYSNLVVDFWKRNMLMMNAITKARGTYFIGILQPLQGVSCYTQKNEAYADEMIGYYKKYYPALAQVCTENPDYLVDFKNIFDSVYDVVYTDDCHIKPLYQKLVASKIYALLVQKKLIPAGH